MDFQVGDWVIHSTHGLGQVREIEERKNNDQLLLYYRVEVADMVIWVPVDEHQDKRLRHPTEEAEFLILIEMLGGPPGELPANRRERTTYLADLMRDGQAESLCVVIRDLDAYHQSYNWSESDVHMMKRARKALTTEWSHVHSISVLEAEIELSKIISAEKRMEP